MGLEMESQTFSTENWKTPFCALLLLFRLMLDLIKGEQGWSTEIKSYHKPLNNTMLFLKFLNILQAPEAVLISLATNEGDAKLFPRSFSSSEFLQH